MSRQSYEVIRYPPPKPNHARTADTAPERHVGFGSKPDGSIDALLQFSTEHGQMLGVAIACGWFLEVFHTVHLLSVSDRKLVIFGGTG